MKRVLIILMMISGFAFGQTQTTDTTTINHSDGSRTVVKCSDTPNATDCVVRNTVLPEWTVKKRTPELKEQEKFCKSQHIKIYLNGITHAPGTMNPDCATAWEQHKAEAK